MGTTVGIGNRVGGGNNFSWSSYWAQKAKLWTEGRNGLALFDLKGDNQPIYPSYIYLPNDGEYSYFQDNGSLDIGSDNFTIFGFIKNEETVKTRYPVFFSKGPLSGIDGTYYLHARATSGYWSFGVQPSDGLIVITSNIDSTNHEWIFFLLEIDQTNKKIRFYINGNLVDSEKSYSGTFSNTDNKYNFYCGGAIVETTPTVINGNIGKFSFSNLGIAHRLLTSDEKITLRTGGYVSNLAAFWPANSWVIADITGNGYNLTNYGFGLPSGGYDGRRSLKYGQFGSRYTLDYGYAVYKHATFPNVLVPLKQNGESPVIPTNYELVKNVAGDLSNHNLADSEIDFTQDEWDKSDTIRFNEIVRKNIYYDYTNPTRWNVRGELNQDIMDKYYKLNYNHIIYPRGINNSYNDRDKLLGVFSFANNKTNSEHENIVKGKSDRGAKLKAGVCLSFDDSQRTLFWDSYDDKLYEDFQWRINMCLHRYYNSKEQWTVYSEYSTRNLLEHNHCIVNHSLNHLDWRTYLETHTIEEFFNSEVSPMQEFLNQKFGYYPTCYGYAQIGDDYNNDLDNYILANGFNFVRRYATIIPENLNEICYDGTSQKVNSLGFNAYSDNEAIGTALMLEHLQYAKDNNKIILFTGHNIGATNVSGFLQISLTRLNALCNFIRQNNMTFYRIDELLPDLFGL